MSAGDGTDKAIRIYSHNIRKIVPHLQEVCELDHDVICLQEADLPEYELKRVETELARAGFHATWAEPTTLSHGGHGRRAVILTRGPIPPVRPKKLVDANASWHSFDASVASRRACWKFACLV